MAAKIAFSLPPNIDITAAPIAFGRAAISKLNKELKDDILITRQRALVALSQLLHDPEKVYEAIKLGSKFCLWVYIQYIGLIKKFICSLICLINLTSNLLFIELGLTKRRISDGFIKRGVTI